MRNVFVPVALIVVGAGWLASSLKIAPEVSWIVVLGLVTAGLAVLLLEGARGRSLVVGVMLISGGVAVFAHQFHDIPWRVLAPMMMMLLGMLLLLTRDAGIPKLEKPAPMHLPGQDDDER